MAQSKIVQPKSPAIKKNTRIYPNQLADLIVKNTKYLREALEKYAHFTPISYNVIRRVLVDSVIEEKYFNEIITKVLTKFTNKYTIDNSIDIDNISNYIDNRAIQRLKGKTDIGVYSKGKFAGVLTSNFGNASSLVVRVIQDEIGNGVSLAVGHVVGEIETHYSNKYGGYVYLHNNKAFRSPASMKLSIIQEVFSIEDHVSRKDFENLRNWYFDLVDGGTSYYAKASFLLLKEAVESRTNKVFTGDLGKLKDSNTKISKTQIDKGFESFSNNYIKAMRQSLNNIGEKDLESITTKISSAINKMADEHKKYYDEVVDTAIITKDFTDKLQELKVIFNLPQAERFNSGQLAAIEKSIVSGVFKSDLANNAQSPSIISYIEDSIIASITGNKLAPFKNSNKANVTKDKVLVPKAKSPKPSPNIGKKSTLPNIKPLPTLRTPQGQFTSLVKLETLIRAGLKQTIIKNMQRPNLRNQTGRFAGSVELKSLSRSRDGAINAFLSYMRYPYATFERDGKQGRKGYYPSRLIDQSVREIATNLVKERMRVIVQ